MNTFSPLLSKRFAKRQTKATKQLIAFRLRWEWFALPIHAVQKVIPISKVYSDPQQARIGLTIYQGKKLMVVDVGHRLFGEPPLQEGKIWSNQDRINEERCLIIIQINANELIGLPIDSQPEIWRVLESSFTALPEVYVAAGNIKCVNSMMIAWLRLATRCPSLFLIEPEQLAQLQLT